MAKQRSRGSTPPTTRAIHNRLSIPVEKTAEDSDDHDVIILNQRDRKAAKNNKKQKGESGGPIKVEQDKAEEDCCADAPDKQGGEDHPIAT